MSSFTINSKEFLKALNFAGKAISNTAITPIFECVLIECKKSGTMIVTGSDSNTVIQTKAKMSEFDLDGEESVKIAAPYDLLSKTLVNLPNAPVTITYIIDGEYNIRIELAYETDLFVIPCEDPQYYLKLPVVKDVESIKLPAQTLQRGIDQVVNFVSDEVMKPTIMGIKLNIKAGQISFVATNALTIGIFIAVYPDSTTEKEILAPGKFMNLISEFIGDQEADIELKVSDQFLKVHFGDWVAYSTLIDETEQKFPDCRRVIPESFEMEATVNAEALKMAIKRANVYADPKTSTMKMCFRESNLFLSAKFAEKNLKCDQDIPIESNIDNLDIGFNMKTLSKLLQTVSGDFKMSFIAPNKAVMINPDRGEGETIDYVIMPVVVLSEVPA